MRFGLQLWSQQTTWPEFRDAALAAEDGRLGLGLDVGPPDGDLRAVGAAHLRGLERAGGARPADLADAPRADGRCQHVPEPRPHRQAGDDPRPPVDGRAVLGIGGAWFEREHDAFGIEFCSGFGERLDRLDEAVMLMRRLLDGERFSHEGPSYTLHDAIVRAAARSRPTCRSWSAGRGRRRRCGPWPCAPMPGTPPGRWTRSGPSSTSSPSTAPTSAATSAQIEKTVSYPIIIRDKPGGRRARRFGALLAAQRDRRPGRRGACSAPRPRWPTRSGRTPSWASRPSSSGCPRRTTARRSTGWPRSASSSGDT